MSLNKEILAKLEEAFLCAFTDEEAALYAGIKPSVLQELNKNKAFKERKELLKQYPSLMAKRNLITKLQSKADNNQLELHQLMSLFRSYFDRYLVLFNQFTKAILKTLAGGLIRKISLMN